MPNAASKNITQHQQAARSYNTVFLMFYQIW